jgi:hypothetical protein
VADLFMLLMVSRPRSGSLRETWVTPATLQMCIALVMTCLICGGLAASGVVRGNGVGMGLVAALVVVLALGAGAVALVGMAQRCTRPSR